MREKYPVTMTQQSLGKLSVDVTSKLGFLPIENAKVSIKKSDDPSKTIEELTTDESGQTTVVDLPAPNVDLSLEPSKIQPYADYTIEIVADRFDTTVIEGCQILAESTALQKVEMVAKPGQPGKIDVIPIEPHTLYAEYPAKIPEAEVKPPPKIGDDTIVLRQPVVPEFIVVHDGSPMDPSAKNYYIQFKDYIKNVASSEIYSTWPDSTITANILAILSFTLNRVYTEWYRAKGKNFTITSSTAYDHKWIYGRNVYSNISRLVDQVFVNYLSRPGIKQPILTQYCDGVQVQCPKWMTSLQ